MTAKLNADRNLPIFGIVAFSLASVWSLYQLFTGSASHPSPIMWAPSVLVELVTAWLVYSCVGLTRKVLMSNITIQDRKFYRVMLVANLALAIPTLGASVWANTLEYHNLLLGMLFPVASIACAVAIGIKDAMQSHKQARDQERADARRKQDEARRKAEQAATEAKRKAEQDAIKEAERARKAFESQLQAMGKAAEVYHKLEQEPGKSISSIAQDFGVSPQAISQHVSRLERAGYVKRNGNGLEVVRQ